MLIDRRRMLVAASPEMVFNTFTGLGGDRGWPPYTWLWQVRGAIDRLVGGVGMRRGRRHPDELREGDVLDFWLVEVVQPNRMLRLKAEMKLPGQGWLQFEVKPNPDARCELVQTALFSPKGLPGFIYWYAIYPIHHFIFISTIKAIAEVAESTMG